MLAYLLFFLAIFVIFWKSHPQKKKRPSRAKIAKNGKSLGKRRAASALLNETVHFLVGIGMSFRLGKR